MKSTKEYEINAATLDDYSGIKTLLESVNLPVEGVREHLNHFMTLKKNRQLSGVVGLEIYDTKAILRSLAVHKNQQGEGYGQILTDQIIQQARKQNIAELYLLTETAESFFKRFGFETISRDLVDAKVKTSIQFELLCPESAPCMRMKLV